MPAAVACAAVAALFGRAGRVLPGRPCSAAAALFGRGGGTAATAQIQPSVGTLGATDRDRPASPLRRDRIADRPTTVRLLQSNHDCLNHPDDVAMI
jgi:hypothetical protein